MPIHTVQYPVLGPIWGPIVIGIIGMAAAILAMRGGAMNANGNGIEPRRNRLGAAYQQAGQLSSTAAETQALLDIISRRQDGPTNDDQINLLQHLARIRSALRALDKAMIPHLVAGGEPVRTPAEAERSA